MAELFENMEKMDIQAERRNTEVQRRRAEAAERKLKTAEQKIKTAEQRAETTTLFLIKSYQNKGMSDEEILKVLTEELGMDKAEAAFKIDQSKK